MSKMDAVRAMREARYAAATSATAPATKPTTKSTTKPTAARTAPRKPAPAATAAPETGAAAEADESLCGHRNMSGRTCTRERGHTAKSHRYS